MNPYQFKIRPYNKDNRFVWLEIFSKGYHSSRLVNLVALQFALTDWWMFHSSENFTYRVPRYVNVGFSLSPAIAFDLWNVVSSYISDH